MVKESIILSINNIDEIYIPHYAMQKAIEGIKRAITLSKNSKEPFNTVLSGGAGTGKTTTCRIIVNAFDKRLEIREGFDVWIIPAFYALIPSPVTIKGVASAMLHSLGDMAPTKGSALDLTYRLGALLKKCETQVIILDELQHLLKKDVGSNSDVKDWLKTIINQFKVSVVIAGIGDCNKIIDTSAQLSRRFPYRFQLKNLMFGGVKNGEYRIFIEDFCKAFLESVDVSNMPDFTAKSNCLPLYVATGGNPADTVNIFKAAALVAFEDERQDVRVIDFAKAYQRITLPNSINSKNNPFNSNVVELNKAIEVNETKKKAKLKRAFKQ